MTNLVLSEKITLDDMKVEQVVMYKYLGHEIRLGRENQTCENFRRMRLAWTAFGRLKSLVFGTDIPVCLKRKVFDQYVLPVMTYGAETLTTKSIKKIQVTQRAKERSMLGMSLRDRVLNTTIRLKTRATDVVERIATLYLEVELGWAHSQNI